MPKVTQVKKARTDRGPCSKCGCEIKKGDAYLYWAFAFRPETRRCAKPECRPKPQDLTQSEFTIAVLNLQEETFDGDTIEDLESAKDDMVSDLEALRDEQEEKKGNMPEGLQESSTGELLQERYDSLDECINTLEGVDISFEEPQRGKDTTDADWEEELATALKDRCQEIREELQSAVGEISC